MAGFYHAWQLTLLRPDVRAGASYTGDAIPYRLLNNYYTSQGTNGQVLVEMWQQAGLNVEIGMTEKWMQIRERGVFTGMPTALQWKSAPSFALEFRVANWR